MLDELTIYGSRLPRMLYEWQLDAELARIKEHDLDEQEGFKMMFPEPEILEPESNEPF